MTVPQSESELLNTRRNLTRVVRPSSKSAVHMLCTGKVKGKALDTCYNYSVASTSKAHQRTAAFRYSSEVTADWHELIVTEHIRRYRLPAQGRCPVCARWAHASKNWLGGT